MIILFIYKCSIIDELVRVPKSKMRFKIIVKEGFR